MIGREYLFVLSKLIRFMAEKREELPSQVRGWVNGRITISFARSYSLMIRRAWLPSPLRYREPGWDPEPGIGIAG